VAGIPVGTAKPTLILMPFVLIPQFIEDLEKTCEDWTWLHYHASKKTTTGTADSEILTRTHAFFNGEEPEAPVLVISSPETVSISDLAYPPR